MFYSYISSENCFLMWLKHFSCNNVAHPYFTFWYLPEKSKFKKKSETATLSQLKTLIILLFYQVLDDFDYFVGNSFTRWLCLRQDPETTKFFKNKVKFVDFCMKWIVLPYSESYFEETKYNSVKFYQFSCIQRYY